MTAISSSILVYRASKLCIGRPLPRFQRFPRRAFRTGSNEFVESRGKFVESPGIEYDPAMSDPAQRVWFLKLAGIFEGGMVVVALALGWLFRVDLVAALRPDWVAMLTGLLGAVPPLLLLVASERFQIPALLRIKRLVLETLGPPLAACRWYELILVAALAGLGEELLFRGVAQSLCERWLPLTGDWNRAGSLILPNVVFGLLHLITPTYAVLAGAMGVYFGVLLDITGSRNVLAPILAHGLYDYCAFLVIVWTIRREHSLHSSQQPAPPQSDAAEATEPAGPP
jgi:uncharacterized protein